LYYNDSYGYESHGYEPYICSVPFQEENLANYTERQIGAPTSPPPSYVPPQPLGTFAVDPRGIARCLFRPTYVWLRGFEHFWFYPIFVGRTSVAGFRWIGSRWVFFGIDLRRIQAFSCF